MELHVFNRGDLIVDKKLKSHGLIIKVERKRRTLKKRKNNEKVDDCDVS